VPRSKLYKCRRFSTLGFHSQTHYFVTQLRRTALMTGQRPAARQMTQAHSTQAQPQCRPNSGGTIPDLKAVGAEAESLLRWRERSGIDPSKHVRIVKVSHMRYQHPDLGRIATFLADFGMFVAKRTDDCVWFHGYGNDHYVYYAQRGEKKFLGGAFEVEDMAQLDKATQIVGAGPIISLDGSPGRGHMVALHDPDGFPINLIYGQAPAQTGTYPEKIVYNYENDKPRVRHFNRFEPGPAAVHKLGHYGLCTQNFERLLSWYTTNFNFAPTDFLYVPHEGDNAGGRPGGFGRKDVGVFMHVDRGSQPVDHHTLFLTKNETRHVHHASFEVHDFDTQHLGHQWLVGKGYQSVWGIGRHILGSQISQLSPMALLYLLTMFFWYIFDYCGCSDHHLIYPHTDRVQGVTSMEI
jgi:hypothetical protein